MKSSGKMGIVNSPCYHIDTLQNLSFQRSTLAKIIVQAVVALATQLNSLKIFSGRWSTRL
jgi:hypothetical protein